MHLLQSALAVLLISRNASILLFASTSINYMHAFSKHLKCLFLSRSQTVIVSKTIFLVVMLLRASINELQSTTTTKKTAREREKARTGLQEEDGH